VNVKMYVTLHSIASFLYRHWYSKQPADATISIRINEFSSYFIKSTLHHTEEVFK
jgi:hypothetical protein